MTGLRFHLSFVLALAVIATFGFTRADAGPWAGSGAALEPRQTPLALSTATYLEFGDARYRLVGVVGETPVAPQPAGSVLLRARALAVYRVPGDDDAVYTREAPGAGVPDVSGWCRWIEWPQPGAPVDMRNRT
jgi:hypothetical protein